VKRVYKYRVNRQPDNLVCQAVQASRDHPEHPAQTANPATRVSLAQRATKATPGRRAPPVNQARWASMENEALPALAIIVQHRELPPDTKMQNMIHYLSLFDICN
jgi:hypothetical protein